MTKSKIYDIFHISLLKQDTIKKKQVKELLEPEQKLNSKDNKEYKIKTICNNEVYTKEAISQ